MKNYFLLSLILVCALFIVVPLAAQERIALHPFMGPSEIEEVSGLLYREIQYELPAVDENYSVYSINLSNLPPDVPEGGFPPWICPSPSITADAVYALTGETAPNPEYPDSYRLRLYLWQIDGALLLGSDEMTVLDIDDLSGLSYFLEWVLSWIGRDSPAVVHLAETDEFKWLYFGIRGGGGYSQWAYDFGNDSTSATQNVTSFATVNFSLQLSVQLARFFEIQTEVNVVSDLGNAEDLITGKAEGPFYSINMTIPVLAKFVLHSGRVKAGLFGGAYYYLPLTQIGSDTILDYFDYSPDLPGFIFGMSAGRRMGSGNLFFDVRYEYDGRWRHNTVREEMYYRNIVRFNIGYEWGFFPK